MISPLDICNRCCVIPDSGCKLAAIWKSDDGFIHVESCKNPTSPVLVRDWVTGMMLEHHDVRFELDDYRNMVKAVLTWYGDPVCSFHLWELVEAERKRDGHW